VVLQTSAGPVPVAGTFLSLALFLSVTAHVAARNVLGDVRARLALTVGPGPAAVAVTGAALSVTPALTVPLAVVVDALLVRRAYALERRLVAYVTAIHAVVSVILGAVVVAGFLLLRTAPL
jgi:hypothetical protein